jgi:hypothetical protein
MDEVPIDFTIVPQYTTNGEYRETIRKIFRMEQQYRIEGDEIIFNDGTSFYRDDIDDESLDELNIDQSRYDDCFKYIWDLTCDKSSMVELYEWAAAKVISVDHDVGIVYLLNYHYLPSFFTLLQKVVRGEEIAKGDVDAVKHAMEYAEYEPFFD